MWSKKDLIGLKGLTKDEINIILDTAQSFTSILTREIKKVPTLRGITVANLFFEPSTRTRSSFELAEKRLSADTLGISAAASSVVKGETLLDTVKNLKALLCDIIVLRHAFAGAPELIAKAVPDVGVINAGDGMHEHPTQALLDMLTMRQVFGRIEGLKVLIVGDIFHSRVARSNIYGLKKFNAQVSVCGMYSLLPKGIDSLCRVYVDLDEAIEKEKPDVLMALRIQKERQEDGLFASLREYYRAYGIDKKRSSRLAKSSIIMHPGPINRGVELAPDMADSDRSAILGQVTNGVAVRMAVLYLISSILRKGQEK